MRDNKGSLRISTQASTRAIDRELRELAKRSLHHDDELAEFAGLDFANHVRARFGVPASSIERRAYEIFHEEFWASFNQKRSVRA